MSETQHENTGLVIAATGHRFKRLGGYTHTKFSNLVSLAEDYLETQKPDEVISGMALGWDMAVAFASLSLDIPLVCAIPFESQDHMWSPREKRQYKNILKEASEVLTIYDGGYEDWKYIKRDEWMVNNCDKLVALWDGGNGGTGYTVRYAMKKKVPFDNLWRQWLRY